MNDLVLSFVTMPMAIKIFKQEKESFLKSKVGNVYQDLIDSVLEKLQSDFNDLKRDMYTKHHLDVKYLGKSNDVVKYSVNKNLVEFTPEELRNKTKELMKVYLASADFDTSWGKG